MRKFGIVFAAMGVKNDVADYLPTHFEDSGALQRVVMFLNLSNDPIIERILTPRCALTAAEYLAFDHGMHILVIMTDMTAYARRCGSSAPPRARSPAERAIPATSIPTWPLSTSGPA